MPLYKPEHAVLMRTPTASTSVLGLVSPQLQPYQELTHMSSSYAQQPLHHHHATFDTKHNPMMESNSNLHARKHSLNQSRYHKKVHGKDYGRKWNEYDEKFVSEMSGNEKELDTVTDQAATVDDAIEHDDSAKFESNLSCELTEFEKQILSKYLTEYSDDGNSTDDLDLVTKCDEEIAHDDQPIILPTTIAALETATVETISFISDECASSSLTSDELLQEEFVVNNEEIQQFAKEYQIGTTLLLKTSDHNNEFNNNTINNNDNDFGLSASIDSSSVIISSSSSLHPHQDQSLHHHGKSSTPQEEDINNNSSCYDKNLKDNNISRTNSTGSSERDTNKNNKNNKKSTSSNYSSNSLRVVFRNNYPIWIGITSCVWGLIIYLMKSYT